MTQALLNEARFLGDRLVESAVWHEGRVNWLAARRERTPSGQGLAQALDPSVHVGTAGVGLFLARLHRFSGDGRHRETAIAAMRQALKYSRYTEEHPPFQNSSTVRLGREWRYGFYLGSLGIGWTAIELADLLGEESLGVAGRQLVEKVARSRSPTHEPDLMFGMASGIATYLSLADMGVKGSLENAERLGLRLFKGALVRGDTWSWGAEARLPESKNAMGMSHGTAGIGYAMALLHERTGDKRFYEAAMGAFRYERAMFDAEEQNWPYFLSPKTQSTGKYPFKTTWCHGGPGIGLSRARAYPVLKDESLVEDVRSAYGTTLKRLLQARRELDPISTPCCGTMGLLECVYEMETLLGRQDALDRARDFAHELIGLHGREAYEAGGAWVDWPTGSPKGTHPGLMQGISGIGHQLLRLHAPERVPTFLVPAQRMEA